MQTNNYEEIPEEIPIVPKEELEQIDVEKHIGQHTKIEGAELRDSKFGKAVLYSTAVVETVNPDGPNEILIRGTRMFGFSKTKDGKLCIAEDSLLHKFLKEKKATRWQDAVGKEVILQTRIGKDGKKYLTF